jgi:hypothetical protein
MATRVKPSSLVKLVRRTGGSARTELAPESQAARTSEYEMNEGDLVRHYELEHHPGGFEYSYDNGGAARRNGRGTVPEGADPHDLQSAMLLLRSWRPRLGEEAHFYVVLGRRLWRVDVAAKGPEMIAPDGVPRLSHRIDGVAVRLWHSAEVQPRHFSLWLSDEPARVPLRMVADASFGHVTMTLTSRSAPAGACSEPPATSAAAAGASSLYAGVIGEAWPVGPSSR